MRSSKGTAQFLLVVFIILVALVIISTKNADKKYPGTDKQTVRAAAVQSNSEGEDIDDDE
jgi:ABC-type cobalt transport system substrate-binding protein